MVSLMFTSMCSHGGPTTLRSCRYPAEGGAYKFRVEVNLQRVLPNTQAGTAAALGVTEPVGTMVCGLWCHYHCTDYTRLLYATWSSDSISQESPWELGECV